ncbi:PREDICTED: clathrin light chain 3-like [Fragaria vesca subsp. vesca]
MSSSPETQSPPSIYSPGGGNGFDEEGLALREWRRRSAIELGKKEKKEKERLKEIIEVWCIC